MTTDRISVAIDARVNPATAGGVAQVTLGLIRALGQLDDGNETYTLLVDSEAELEYFKPAVGPNQKFALREKSLSNKVSNLFARTSKRMLEAASGSAGSYRPEIPVSDGSYERTGCDLVHFPHQKFVLCALPTVYNPHDLQHIHFPQFMSAGQLAARDTLYRAGCHFSRVVASASEWVKEDLVQSYGLNPDKVQIIPWAPPTEGYVEPTASVIAAVKQKYDLPDSFVLYPAMTWPHKNHLRLLDALAYLRDKCSTKLNLVCTGSQIEPYWSSVSRHVDEHNLHGQVKFLGFVPDTELRAIYRLARLMVMPTLFESDSSPIYESWADGTPVACSNVTALPAQVMDAALLFDPLDVVAMANSMAELAKDDALQSRLRERGFRRLGDFDWERTAKAYRAVYRRTAGRSLNDEDRHLLTWDWMKKPLERRASL